MKYYSIQTVSELCGLSTHCIRAWEKRYGAIRPERADNGRRLYTESELNRLQMLGRLSSLGNSISLIANLPDEELKTLLVKMEKGKGGQVAFQPMAKSLVEPKIYLMNLFMALNAYKLDVLTHELNKASMDLSCRDFALEVVAGLFRKVGDYVAQGKMSIAQEHTLSAITKFFIGRRIAQHYRSGREGALKVTLATPRGEHHSIGLLLAALLLAEHDVNFIYLGEDLPNESIADAAQASGSQVVLLAISPAYDSINRNINQVLLDLRGRLPNSSKIWIGGAVENLRVGTFRDDGITTFKCLMALDEKLAQIVGAQ